jgi:hypothetical protein
VLIKERVPTVRILQSRAGGLVIGGGERFFDSIKGSSPHSLFGPDHLLGPSIARVGSRGSCCRSARQSDEPRPCWGHDKRSASGSPYPRPATPFLHASNERDFDTVFATSVQLRAGGLVIGADALFNNWSEHLAALALRYAVPTIYAYRVFAASGGLMSYGSNPADLYHPVGVYTGRILKGEKPAELPVQQVTKVELIINLTAKTLGLTFPLTLLGRADEVIE